MSSSFSSKHLTDDGGPRYQFLIILDIKDDRHRKNDWTRTRLLRNIYWAILGHIEFGRAELRHSRKEPCWAQSSKLNPDSLSGSFYPLIFSFHRFSFLSRESGLRVVTPPEWIIFLCILRTQPKHSLGHQIKRKLVCPIHLVGVLQKVSVQSLIFLCLKSLQLRPIFLVLNIPTYCRDKSSKSLMNFIFCLFIPMKRHSST